MIHYSIDNYSWNRISGWAYSKSKKNLKVKFYSNNILNGYCYANKYRKDLESIEGSGGCISFDFLLNSSFRYKDIKVVIEDISIYPKWKKNEKRSRQILNLYHENMKSLEIGPLDKPILSTKNPNVFFADHLDYESLIKKYKRRYISTNLNYKNFAPVDYNLQLLLDSKKKFNFEYVVASHFLEHYPNPIYFLKKISYHLQRGGYLSLALPDKRFTFDKNHTSTAFNDWMIYFTNNLDKPHFGNIFNALLIKFKKIDPVNAEKKALKETMLAISSNEYFDCHVSYFTKKEFLEIINKLIFFKIINFKVVANFSNNVNAEFIVILQKI